MRNLYRIRQFPSNELIYIHIPKTAGKSIVKALNIIEPGHFTLLEQLKYRGSNSTIKVVISVRDPVERIVSTFKYAHKNSHNSIASPLRFLRKYSSPDEFIQSDIFGACVNHHYFFYPISKYIAGIESMEFNQHYVRFSHLREDLNGLYDAELPHINKSPDLLKRSDGVVSSDSVDRIQRNYRNDYLLLDSINYY